MRLIDADALIKRAAMRGHCLRPFVTAYHMCVDVKDIEKAPTIDAVSVVRCKECKYGMESHLKPYEDRTHLCRYSWDGRYNKPDHFCSYGERRENNALD